MTDVTQEIVNEFQDLQIGGELKLHTRYGEVNIVSMERKEQEGVAFLEIYLGNISGDPHYRIVNPPELVPDRNGHIMIDQSPNQDGSHVIVYRRDPLMALAEVLVTHRGGQ